MTVREARAHLADRIKRAEEGASTVITRNGTPVAAVVPIADFEALEEAADAMLTREAEAVLAEDGPTVTMAELLTDLFTEHGPDGGTACSPPSGSPRRRSGSAGPSAGPAPCAS